MNDSSTTPRTAGTTLEAAQHYMSGSWFPIALHGVVETPSGPVCTCEKGPDCHSAGKHPVGLAWQKQAAPDLSPWGRRRVPTNVGIATGRRSGFWVLDIDTPAGLEQLQQAGQLTPSYTVRTGGGGWQIYYQLPADFVPTNRDKMLPKGIDVRGEGGQVVAPPSRSAKGFYEVFRDGPVQPAPEWLIELLRPREAAPVASPAQVQLDAARPQTRREAKLEEAVIKGELARLDDLPRPWFEGARWDVTIFEVACQLVELANAGWSALTIEQAYQLVVDRAPRDHAWDGAAEKFASAVRSVGEKARVSPSAAGADDAFSYDYQGPQVIAGSLALGSPAAALGADLPAGMTPESYASMVTAPRGGWPMRTWDDTGNAQRMVDHFGSTLRWIDEAGRWAVFSAGHWTVGASTVGVAHAQQMIERLEMTEALSYSEDFDPDEEKMSPRDAFLKWAKSQRMAGRINSMVDMAKARPEFASSVTDFDRHPDYLNVANGIVDLRTGDLLPHSPEAMMRHISPVPYDPTATCPEWLKFLERVIQHPGMRDYLQRIVGYSLTGLTGEQAMFLHHGSGANGKSVFLMVLSHIAGDYGQVVPRETLLTKGAGGEHPTAIARMVGRRFLQVSETAAGRRLDEEIVKGLTGGEQQTARFMAKDFFDFTPTGKIHYVTNHLPRLTDAESIWRRLHLIRWAVTIPEEERDSKLPGRIIENEAAGVLAWIVRGAIAWREQGLAAPALAREDLAAYRKDQDELGRFLFEMTVPVRDSTIDRDTLYQLYTAWCGRNGARSIMAADFHRALRERGLETHTVGRTTDYIHVAIATALAPSPVE